MPVQVSYPGVYVQEEPSGVQTITGVSTSIALFVGTGRTIGNADGTGTTFMLNAGVSISYAPRFGQ